MPLTLSLARAGLLTVPDWWDGAVAYEALMGSVAYGVATDLSDRDLCGFCVPPPELVFPCLAGEIPGFGTPAPRFDQVQKHHIPDPDDPSGTVDVAIYSIVRYFHLAMENNPNILDSLFVPESCVAYAGAVGQRVRERRRTFLHRGAWVKFRGYAASQLHKLAIKNPEPGSRRAELVAQHGYDVKFAYHVVRLLDEAEQILTVGDIDLQRDRERLRAIRRGEWSLEEIRAHAERKGAELDIALERSALPTGPDEPAIRDLLCECLEAQYGALPDFVRNGRR